MDNTFDEVNADIEALFDEMKPRAIVHRLADVERENVTWMWQGFLPHKKLVIVDGMPGVGKSTLTADIAAKVSTGATFPCGTENRARGVLFLAVEDGVADTIRPRVEAAGGDVERVYAMSGVEIQGQESAPDLSKHIEIIRNLVIEHDIGLIIIDPIMALLGANVDSYRDQDVRSITTPLARLAEELDVIVLVVRHPNKSISSNALMRGGGSMAFIGAARVGWVVGKDPSDESRRILAIAKSNLAMMADSLQFQLVTDEQFGCARIEWLGKSMVSADILYSEPNQDERNQTDEAMEWLQDFLGDSEIDSKVAKQKAGDAGISEKALRRAREKLDVRVIRRGKGKEHVTTWLLAPHTPTDAPLNVGMSSVNGHEWPSQGELSPNWPESPLGTNTWSR
jgi:archaellum biogenesis ATPase FlaH